MASFNVVFFPEFETGAIDSPEMMDVLRSMLSSDCALFLGVKANQTTQAFDFARQVLKEEAEDLDPYLAFVWNQMTTKCTPKQHQLEHVKTSLVFVWRFVRKINKDEDIILNKYAGNHIVDSRLSNCFEICDQIADHLIWDRRLVINPPTKKATTEYAIWNTTDNGEIKRPVGQLNCSSSTRKARIFRAYLQKVSRKQLVKDKTNLMNFYQERPHDENSPILRMIHNKTQREVMGLVKHFLKKKKEIEDKGSENNNNNKHNGNGGCGGKKRKLIEGVGINKPVPITLELETFLRENAKVTTIHDNKVSRVDVVRGVSKYIKDNNLNNGRVVKAREDPGLSSLLQKDTPPDIDITFFNLYRYINHHFK